MTDIGGEKERVRVREWLKEGGRLKGERVSDAGPVYSTDHTPYYKG